MLDASQEICYSETHLFPQFLENSRPNFKACNTLISSKNKNLLRRLRMIILRKICLVSPQKDFQGKIGILTIFSCSFHFPVYCQPDFLKANEVISITIKILLTLGDHSRNYSQSNPWQSLLYLASANRQENKTNKRYTISFNLCGV